MDKQKAYSEYSAGFVNYLNTKGLQSVTRRGYVFDARQFMEWLSDNDLNIDQVGRHEAQQFIDFLSDRQYLPTTIAKKVSSLRAFFDYLEKING